MSTLHCQRFNPVNYCQQANENKGLQAYHLSQLNKWVIMHCQFVCIGPHELNSKLVSKLTMQPDLSLSNNYQIFSLDHMISFTNRNNEIFNLQDSLTFLVLKTIVISTWLSSNIREISTNHKHASNIKPI